MALRKSRQKGVQRTHTPKTTQRKGVWLGAAFCQCFILFCQCFQYKFIFLQHRRPGISAAVSPTWHALATSSEHAIRRANRLWSRRANRHASLHRGGQGSHERRCRYRQQACANGAASASASAESESGAESAIGEGSANGAASENDVASANGERSAIASDGVESANDWATRQSRGTAGRSSGATRQRKKKPRHDVSRLSSPVRDGCGHLPWRVRIRATTVDKQSKHAAKTRTARHLPYRGERE